MKKIYLDASVIFSAIYSKTGGSRRLLELVKQKKFIGITSQSVINELKDNLHKLKMGISQIDNFIGQYNLFVREEIKEEEITPYKNITDVKDAHVVAGAIITTCQYLVTLDKKHLDNPKVQKKLKNLQILSPKKLLGSSTFK